MFVAIDLNHHRSLHHLPHDCFPSSEPSSQSPSPTTCLLPFIRTFIAVFITYRMFVAIHLNQHRSLHHLPHVCCHPSEPSSQSSSPTACLLPSIWTTIAVFITYHMFVAIHLKDHRSLHHLQHVCCHPSEPPSQSSSPTTCLLPFIWTSIAVFITYLMFVAIHLNQHCSLHHLPHVCCHSSEPALQSLSPTICLLPSVWTIIAIFIAYHMIVAIHLNHHRSLHYLATTFFLPSIWTIIAVFITYHMFVAIHLNHHHSLHHIPHFVAIHLNQNRSFNHLPHVCCHWSEPSSQSTSPTACLLPLIWTIIAVSITFHMIVSRHLNHHRSRHHLPHVFCHSSEPSLQFSSPTACLLPFIWTSIAVFITYHMFVAIHLNHHRSLHHLQHVCCHQSEPPSQYLSPTTCLLPSIWKIIAVFITYSMSVAIHLNHHRSLHHLPHVCCHSSEPPSQSSSPTACLLPFIWTIIAVFITYHMFVAIHLNHHHSLHHHHTSIASEYIWCYCSGTLW